MLKRIATGFAVVGFIVGGGYSVWRHEQSLAQPIAEIKILPKAAPVIAKESLKKPASVKQIATAIETIKPAEKPKLAPAIAPFQAPAENPPANTTAAEPAPAPANAPSASSGQNEPAPVPEQASSAPANVEPAPPVNSEPAPSSPPPAEPPVPSVEPARILISEIFFNPVGSDGEKEFVELYNAGGIDADLKDWSLIIQNATSSPTGSSLAKFGSKPEDILVIKAHGFLLIGLNSYSQSPAGDIVRSAPMVNTSSTIYLKDADGQQIDAVTYDGALLEGDSVARENYSGDFIVRAVPTPQNSASPTAP